MSEDAKIRLQNLLSLGHNSGDLAAKLGKQQSYWSELLAGRKSFGEKAARSIEAGLQLPRGWLDVAHADARSRQKPNKPEEAHLLSPKPFTIPNTITWGEVMSGRELPEVFALDMPDDALSGRIDKGVGMVFECALAPEPGKVVLISDKDGGRHVRIYEPVRGVHWVARARREGYATLDSEADGLTVLATMSWRRD